LEGQATYIVVTVGKVDGENRSCFVNYDNGRVHMDNIFPWKPNEIQRKNKVNECPIWVCRLMVNFNFGLSKQ